MHEHEEGAMPDCTDSAEVFATADLFDSAPDRYRQLDFPFRHFGGSQRFSGPCSTIRAGSDPATIREAVDEPGSGRVLIIDGSTDPRLACLGGLMARRAMASGWAGAVIVGAVRDTAVLAGLDFGVAALRTTAMRPFGERPGERDVVLHLGEVAVKPGDMVFVDQDAVLILPREAMRPDG